MYQKFYSPQCSNTSCPLWLSCERTSTSAVYSEFGNESQPVDLYVISDYPDWKSVKLRTPFMGVDGATFRTVVKEEAPEMTYALSYLVRGWPYNPDTLPNPGYRTMAIGNIPDFQLERARTRPLTTHPQAREIVASCSPFWKQDIATLRPKMILAMGAITKNTLFPNNAKSVTDLLDETLYYEGIPVRFNHSPYMMVRNPSSKTTWENQLRNVLHGRHAAYSSEYKPEIVMVDTISKAEDLVQKIANSKDAPSYDTETANLNKRHGTMLGTMQFNMDPTTAYVVPWKHRESPFMGDDFKHLKEAFRPLFTGDGLDLKFPYWVMHNGKFELNITRNELGCTIDGTKIFDTQAGAFLLDENRMERRAYFKYGTYTLKQLALDFLGFDGYKSDVLSARGEGSLMDLPLDKLAEYGGLDTGLTFMLKDAQIREAKRQNYLEQFLNLLLYLYDPDSHLFSEVERNGMPASLPMLRNLISRKSPLLTQIEKIEKELKNSPEVVRANKLILNQKNPIQSQITPLAGDPWVFKFSKTGHPQTLFFDVMGLEPIKFGKSGAPSVDNEFQKAYESIPMVANYAEWTETRKMFDSFAKQLYDYVDPSGDKVDCKTDSRIRPSYLISTVVTGRVACRGPNLQAIPRGDSPVKKSIKDVFEAKPGKVMVQLDYRFNEMFWVTVVSQDKEMAKKIMSGKLAVDEYRKNPTEQNLLNASLYGDIHKQNASSAFKLPIESITKDQRQAAKGISFGILYDSTIRSVAQLYGLDPNDTKEMFDNFYDLHSGIYSWKMRMKEDAARQGFVETPHGRRRRFPIFDMFRDENGFFQMERVPQELEGRVADALRQASNAPVQGVASDSGLIGAYLFANYIHEHKKDWTICNAVHDSCVFEVPYNELDDALAISERCFVDDMMEYMNAVWNIDFIVPAQIDFELGKRWGSLQGWDWSTKNLNEIKESLKEYAI